MAEKIIYLAVNVYRLNKKAKKQKILWVLENYFFGYTQSSNINPPPHPAFLISLIAGTAREISKSEVSWRG